MYTVINKLVLLLRYWRDYALPILIPLMIHAYNRYIVIFKRLKKLGNKLLWDVGIHSDNHVQFRSRPAKSVPSRVRLLDTWRCVLRSG
jgi:hypothetical protein